MENKGNTVINNHRIAKNTLYMYIRMFLILGITLFTARVIINTLGIDDYGIYNVIGGVVVLFSFVNISLRTSFQRFFSYELGKNHTEEIHKIMSSCLVIVTLFSFIFLILSETLGLWFVLNKLVIPENRLTAALWVYQFSIATFILNLYQTPFQAIIIAYEKLSFYALYSIVDVVMKLLVAYAIYLSPIDKLILYGALGVMVSIISVFFACIYVLHHLNINLKAKIHPAIIKPIFSYAGWSMTNSSCVIVTQQGGNILLNMFFGVIANGAFGIANQVSAAINGFVSNFQSAFNPQIVKSYAAQENEALYRLINRASLFSFYLLLIISVPFFVECDYILKVWLGETPLYAGIFCQLMICYFLIDAAQAPLWMLINATGNIRTYQIWSGTLTLLNLPLAGLILYLGNTAYWVFIVRVGLNLLTAIIRPIYVHNLVKQFPLSKYLIECILPIFKVLIIMIGILYYIKFLVTILPIIRILISIFITILIVCFFGVNKNDKFLLYKMIKYKFRI